MDEASGGDTGDGTRIGLILVLIFSFEGSSVAIDHAYFSQSSHTWTLLAMADIMPFIICMHAIP